MGYKIHHYRLLCSFLHDGLFVNRVDKILVVVCQVSDWLTEYGFLWHKAFASFPLKVFRIVPFFSSDVWTELQSSECFGILVPGGNKAFTNIVADVAVSQRLHF